MKTDGLPGRCFLKCIYGVAMKVLLADCGLYLRVLLRYLRQQSFLCHSSHHSVTDLVSAPCNDQIDSQIRSSATDGAVNNA